MRKLPEMEAARLAIYFEEETKHARHEEEKRRREADAYDTADTSRTVLELSDGEGEEYAFEDLEEQEGDA